MAEAPAWARSLVMTVCAEADAPLPRLTWRHRDRPTSSGVTRQIAGIVSVVAGRDPIDQRLTLLHELAHWLTPIPRHRRRRISHHDAAFYDAAFALYRRHGVPDAAALAGESARYPSSLAHARRLGVPGAEEAWRDRRSAPARAGTAPATDAGAGARAWRPSRPRRPLDPLRRLRHPGGWAEPASSAPPPRPPRAPGNRLSRWWHSPGWVGSARNGMSAVMHHGQFERIGRRPILFPLNTAAVASESATASPRWRMAGGVVGSRATWIWPTPMSA